MSKHSNNKVKLMLKYLKPSPQPFVSGHLMINILLKVMLVLTNKNPFLFNTYQYTKRENKMQTKVNSCQINDFFTLNYKHTKG